MNDAVLRSFLAAVDDLAGRAALTISGGEGTFFPEDIVDRVAGVAGVRLAVPTVRSMVFPDDESGELLTVLGVDLGNEAAVRVYHDTDHPEGVVNDLIEFLGHKDSIILGRQWAGRRGLRVGDPVNFVTPTGVATFVIRGLIEPLGVASTLGGRLVVMDIYAAERAFARDGMISQIDVVLDAGADVPSLGEAIARVLPSGLSVREPGTEHRVIRTTVAGFQSMLLAFAFLAVIAGFVICYGRLRTLFEARVWEVGLYRSVGLRRSVVFIELLKEGLLLGGVGISLGLPLGLAIAEWAFPFLARATAINFRLPVTAKAPSHDVGALALGGLVGVVAALLAATLPAYRLANTHPVGALRMRGREHAPVDTRRRVLVSGCLLAIVGGLLALQLALRVPQVGVITTVLIAAVGLSLAGPLVMYGARGLAVAFGNIFGAKGRFAALELTHHGNRATLAISTLGVGLGAVLFFGVLGRSFERSLVSQLGARFQADLVVNSPFVAGGWMAAPIEEGIVSEIAEIPGVRTVAAQHLRDVELRGGSISLFSYDTACFLDTRVCRWPLMPGASSDALAEVALRDGVLVSASVAREQALSVGADISLPSPSGPQTFRVVGIERDEPAKAVVMSRQRYRAAWNDRHVTWVHVVLSDPTKRETVAKAIAAHLGQRHRVQVRSMVEFLAYLSRQVREAFRLLYVMEAITLLLMLFGVADALAAGVMERTRQFGMMRAVGLGRVSLFELILLEGAGLGVLGTLLAVGIGLTLSLFWVYVQFPALVGWNVGLDVPGSFIVAGGLAAIALAVVGAIGPAIGAASLAVPVALRED